MWSKNLLYFGLMILVAGCAESEKYSVIEKDSAINTRSTTFTGGTEGVSVLIFSKIGNDFIYRKSIDSGWSEDGKVNTRLQLGDYKFLFVKTPSINTVLTPELTGSNVKLEDISIRLKEDASQEGYYLEADEIFLPESAESADRIYKITGGETVHGKLTRAVSQIVLKLNRAANNNGVYEPLPYDNNVNIMNQVRQVKMNISGVGKVLSLSGSQGYANTLYETNRADSITPDGFAVLNGPLVFPAVQGTEANVDITILPMDGSAFPEFRTQVSGAVERNKKLIITLWVTATYRLVDINVNTEPISKAEDGDTGVWE